MQATTRATLDDLMRMEGKAELIGGRIVGLMATGSWPNEVAGNIYVSLWMYTRKGGQGKAYTDNIGFAVPMLPSGRESFTPDASYFLGAVPMKHPKFVQGPATFAVEVRSENDYSQSAETEMADKRDDYFQAGTLVVWDVDPVAETVTCYRSSGVSPVVFRRGDVADAEPAVPGWRMAVDDVFTPQ